MAIRMKKEKEGKGYEWIEVHSVHEVKVVLAYNKEIEKQRKRDVAYHYRCLSMDQLLEEHDYEFASNEKSALDKLIEEERNQEIWNAILELSKPQQYIIIEYFWNNKSLRQIAREKGVCIHSIHKSYLLALEKLKEKLKNL